MINPNAHLVDNIFDTESLDRKPTRNGFGRGLEQLGEKHDDVIAICADLAESTRMHWFKEKFPNRYVEVGVAEQHLAALGSGFANYGKVPYITSYAAFSPGRNNEQIRTTISLNNVPVKIAGSHAGLSVGPDGATHQALEDIGLMRMQPHMTVLSPCDMIEAQKATVASYDIDGPVYIRLAREKSPVFTSEGTPFEVGKAQTFFTASDPQVGIITTGALTYKALQAAQQLTDKRIPVKLINLSTIKPLDGEAIEALARETGAIVTVEEHQIAGGMGSVVAEHLSQAYPVPIEFIGVHDRFGQSGTAEELYNEYELNVEHIVAAAKKAKSRK